MSSAVSRSLLFIDDDPASLSTARGIAEALGYRFVGALGARDGLRTLAEDPLPAAVLIDLYMPAMDAVQFRIAQLQDARLAAVPTVVVVSTPVSSRLADSIGMPLVQKPLQRDRVAEAIARGEAMLALRHRSRGNG